ncbi:hypothetical protein K438DRAFT_1933781 [Mycena galopus ATCC 62051]|nr:hypothetical protein K438DRAFT_1933781 [Mycena galopus ATCC 62051]
MTDFWSGAIVPQKHGSQRPLFRIVGRSCATMDGILNWRSYGMSNRRAVTILETRHRSFSGLQVFGAKNQEGYGKDKNDHECRGCQVGRSLGGAGVEFLASSSRFGEVGMYPMGTARKEAGAPEQGASLWQKFRVGIHKRMINHEKDSSHGSCRCDGKEKLPTETALTPLLFTALKGPLDLAPSSRQAKA